MCDRTVALEQHICSATSSARETFDIAQQQRRPLALGEHGQAFFEVSAMLGSQHGLLGAGRWLAERLHQAVDLAEVDLPVAPQKIDGGVACDPRQPVRRFVEFL